MGWCDLAHTDSTMHWRQFVMDLESLSPDRVEEILTRNGAVSIALSGGGDDPVLEPILGETPLWSQTRISALFPDTADIGYLQQDLKCGLGLATLPAHRVESLQNRVWEREWLKYFRPTRFGKRLWICPNGVRAPASGGAVIELDPGLAFGTGTHTTTALCLEWLDAQELDGRTVLDYGCGSGILSIAALKLGASRAVAVDIEPQAIQATRSNARKNGVQRRLAVSQRGPACADRFDIVVANILAEPLIASAERLAGHVELGGSLALSGILAAQADAVLDAYRRWIDFEPSVYRVDGNQTWAFLAGRRHMS